MADKVKNLQTELLYEVPSTLALFFASLNYYSVLVDPSIRELNPNMKGQLKHWAAFYAWGTKYLAGSAVVGSLASVAAYSQLKEKYWLYGGATLLSVVPFTFIFMMKTNNKLKGILKNTTEPEVKEEEKQDIKDTMKKWCKLNTCRAVLATVAAAFFFVAKHQAKNSI